MEQRASSLQQRLEARRNMFLAQKSGEGGNSGPSSIGGQPSSYVASRTGKNINFLAKFSLIVNIHELYETSTTSKKHHNSTEHTAIIIQLRLVELLLSSGNEAFN